MIHSRCILHRLWLGLVMLVLDCSSLHRPIHCYHTIASKTSPSQRSLELRGSGNDDPSPVNEDYQSPLQPGSDDSFISSIKKSVDNFISEERDQALAIDDSTTTSSFSELPESFEDAVYRAARICNDCIRYKGLNKLRIDFDTSVGDKTYTTLQNTLPVVRLLTCCLGIFL